MIAIEIVKGRAHWHWRIKDMGNHKILAASETFPSRYNAERAADGFLAEIGAIAGRRYEPVKVRGYNEVYRHVINGAPRTDA